MTVSGERTESGRWVDVQPQPHECRTPNGQYPNVPSGSVWECDCGQLWIAETYNNRWIRKWRNPFVRKQKIR